MSLLLTQIQACGLWQNLVVVMKYVLKLDASSGTWIESGVMILFNEWVFSMNSL